MSTPFSEQISYLNSGDFNNELKQELQELVKMVRLTGKQGTISLTIKVGLANKMDAETVKLTPSYKTTLPQLEQAETIMFSTADGDLLRNDPKQYQVELK